MKNRDCRVCGTPVDGPGSLCAYCKGKPRILDLFCGAGGAAVGYHRAGFDVVGVDIEPQPNYPFPFERHEALSFLGSIDSSAFDVIHASPPCQRFSKALDLRSRDRDVHSDLIAPTRELLQAAELPYVIENVPGAPLENPTQLCGSGFGLDLRRHRLFETNISMMGVPCSHGWQALRFPSTPRKDGSRPLAPMVNFMAADPHRLVRFSKAMGIDWMTWDELVEAIPPSYTEHIGFYLRKHLAPNEEDL